MQLFVSETFSAGGGGHIAQRLLQKTLGNHFLMRKKS